MLSLVATVLTVYGIETFSRFCFTPLDAKVATVLTVYGIETLVAYSESIRSLIVLQQCLPFTVLKL